MKFLIIDDEPYALSRMERLLGELHFSNFMSTTIPSNALELCRSNKFDIAFVDIEMPKTNGMGLAKDILSIDKSIFIIFTTAYSEYALDAFKIGATDYLVKPIMKDDLQKSINRVVNYATNQHSGDSNELIIAKSENNLIFIGPEEIYYVEAQLHETSVRTKEGLFYTNKKLSDFIHLLGGKHFVRAHRSQIVNLKKVSKLESIEQSKYCIHFKDINEVVYTSKSGAQELREIFKNC